MAKQGTPSDLEPGLGGSTLTVTQEVAQPTDAADVSSRSAEFTLGKNDIGCGRGQAFCTHIGNMRFREIVGRNVETYLNAHTKVAKTALIASILDEVRQGDGDGSERGRFMRKCQDGAWVELGDMQSRDKVSNALRAAVALKQKKATEPEALAANPATEGREQEPQTTGVLMRSNSDGSTTPPTEDKTPRNINAATCQPQIPTQLKNVKTNPRQKPKGGASGKRATAPAKAKKRTKKAMPGKKMYVATHGEEASVPTGEVEGAAQQEQATSKSGGKKNGTTGQKRKKTASSPPDQAEQEPIKSLKTEETSTKSISSGTHATLIPADSEASLVSAPASCFADSSALLSGFPASAAAAAMLLPRQPVVTPRNEDHQSRLVSLPHQAAMVAGLAAFPPLFQPPPPPPPRADFGREGVMEALDAAASLFLLKAGFSLPMSG